MENAFRGKVPYWSKSLCCYNCELHFEVGWHEEGHIWDDLAGQEDFSISVTHLICADCCTEHYLLHAANPSGGDRFYSRRSGPCSLEITTEELARRTRWVMEWELQRLKGEEDVAGWHYWIGDDVATAGQPPRLNLFPGETRMDERRETWRERMKEALPVVGVGICFILLVALMLPSIIEAEWRKRFPSKITPDEEKRRQEHVQQWREKRKKMVEQGRENWHLFSEAPEALYSYIAILEDIPDGDKFQFYRVRKEIWDIYCAEVIARLSCGFCGVTGKLCYEWTEPNCPRCGKAELDTPPYRVTERQNVDF